MQRRTVKLFFGLPKEPIKDKLFCLRYLTSKGLANKNIFVSMSKTLSATLPDRVVMSKIYIIREQKVMLDEDLAELYGVETRRLNEQVKRNMDRFPEDLFSSWMKRSLPT